MTTATDERVTTAAVMDATGATLRQLGWWVRADYLHPDNAERGSGFPWSWPPAEVAVAVRMAQLLRIGFTLPAAAVLARQPGTLRQVALELLEIEP